jgi:membrane fusion protein, multidrug efflux system
MTDTPNDRNAEHEEREIAAVPLYRKGRIVIPLLIIIALCCYFGWAWYVDARDHVSTDDAYIDGDRVTVSARMLGRITGLGAGEGDTVTQGMVLVRLDDTDLQAQAVQARSACTLAEENAKLAAVSVARAVADFRRAEEQFRGKIIPREQFDHAQNELDAARARQEIGRAQVAAARAQLQVVQAQLLNTVIVAPMRGVVSKRWTLPGDVVQPAQPILSVYSTDSVWLTANLEETKIAVLKSGDRVEIEVDAYPETKFSGNVLQLGTNTAAQFALIPPNNASGNFTKVTQRIPVKISVRQEGNGPALRLLPGMSATIAIKVR